jgi:hypothetical protein
MMMPSEAECERRYWDRLSLGGTETSVIAVVLFIAWMKVVLFKGLTTWALCVPTSRFWT